MRAYKVDFLYENDVELLDIVVKLFSKTMLKQPLSDKEVVIIREYMINGYSKQTKDSIRLTLNIKNSQTLNTMNYHLQKKGYLKPHPSNQRLKLLNDELVKLRECFLSEPNNDKKVYIVNLVNGNVSK